MVRGEGRGTRSAPSRATFYRRLGKCQKVDATIRRKQAPLRPGPSRLRVASCMTAAATLSGTGRSTRTLPPRPDCCARWLRHRINCRSKVSLRLRSAGKGIPTIDPDSHRVVMAWQTFVVFCWHHGRRCIFITRKCQCLSCCGGVSWERSRSSTWGCGSIRRACSRVNNPRCRRRRRAAYASGDIEDCLRARTRAE